MEESKKTICIKVDYDLYRDIRYYCFDNNITTSALIIECLKNKISRKETKKSSWRNKFDYFLNSNILNKIKGRF